MEVMFTRGSGIFIVFYKKAYYLINISEGSVTKAKPPEHPDMFLKFGYFEVVDTIELSTKEKLEALLLGSA